MDALVSEWEPVPVPEGSEISTDAQHEALQEHIARCDQCKTAIEQSGRHMSDLRIGTRTKMCSEYLKIVRYFATQ